MIFSVVQAKKPDAASQAQGNDGSVYVGSVARLIQERGSVGDCLPVDLIFFCFFLSSKCRSCVLFKKDARKVWNRQSF
jgi:hypothetical protein